MGFGRIISNISLEKDIYSRVDDVQILNYYLGITKLPIMIKSPLREDKNPSFSVFMSRDGKIRYKDLAKGERGDIIDLLSQYWNLDFQQTIDRIYSDMKYFTKDNVRISKSIHSERIAEGNSNKELLNVECKVRDWELYDLEYWNSQGISIKWLQFGDIFPFSHSIITTSKGKYIFNAEKYAYAYVERKDGIISLKLYQPKSKKYKWINNHDSSVWDLWDKLPAKGENLIITSSRKDALCVWENTGIPCTCMQAESYIPKDHIINELKSRFKNIYVLYDNDFNAEENHGELLGKEICKHHNLKFIQIPEEYKTKDPSDCVNKYGRIFLNKLINKLIKI